MSVVAGDPASCSRLGGSLRQLATGLRTTARVARDAFDDGDQARPGPVLAQARRRVDGLDAATAAAAREVDRVGAALQAHSADLAEAVADSRRLASRATETGLRVSAHGEVATAWGVSGVADGDTSAHQLEVLGRIQTELDTVAALVAQRRHRLVLTLRESQAVLAAHAEALRR
jgi:hypothetical protein